MASIKTKKKYRVITAMNPKTQEKTLLRPIIDERETYYSDHVVEYALKNGYVRGQFHDMLGALNGFVQAIQELGKEGKDVNLSNWLRVHGELTGTVDPTEPVITSKNEYKVCITALKELKLKADAFSWTRTDGPEPDMSPKILGVIGRDRVEGQVSTIYEKLTVSMKNVQTDGLTARLALYDKDDGHLIADTTFGDTVHAAFEVVDANTATYILKSNATPQPDGMWTDEGHRIMFELKLADGTVVSTPITVVFED